MLLRTVLVSFIAAFSASAQAPAEWFERPLVPAELRQSEMYAFVNAGIPELPRFNSLAEWERYKARLRPQILKLLGVDDILKHHSFRMIHRGTLERDGYVIEKIAYESYPGTWVPALVWVPKGIQGKAPAMVSMGGHWYCESRAGAYQQARAYNLVRRGFIVIDYDYIGCGERASFDICAPGAYGAVDHLVSLFSYTRRTPTGVELLDGIRAIDYLYTRPDVDRTRLGFTGESGGGNSTYWVSALDDRVTLAAVVCAPGLYEQWIKENLDWDWHQIPPGIRAIADMPTLFALIAPRPLLLVKARADLAEFTLPNIVAALDYAGRIYKLYGGPQRLSYYESPTEHGYQADKREAMYRWVSRWMFDGSLPLGTSELSYAPEQLKTLRVGLPEGNLTLPELQRRWVAESPAKIPVPASIAEARRFQAEKRRALEALVARQEPGAMPGYILLHGADPVVNGYAAELLRFEAARDVQVPAVFVRKIEARRQRYKTIVLLGKRNGTSAEARALLDAGYALLLFDPRGTGEVEWGGGRTSNFCNLVGRSWIGLWAEDVSKIVNHLTSRPDVEQVAVVGYDLLGKAALYAAALDPRIAAAAVSTDTLSYRQEATSGLSHMYADVPRILSWGDTPQLAALVAPRPLLVLEAGVPVSANAERMEYFAPLPRFAPPPARVREEALAENYAWTRSFYKLWGADGQLETGLGGSERAARIVAWFKVHF